MSIWIKGIEEFKEEGQELESSPSKPPHGGLIDRSQTYHQRWLMLGYVYTPAKSIGGITFRFWRMIY